MICHSYFSVLYSDSFGFRGVLARPPPMADIFTIRVDAPIPYSSRCVPAALPPFCSMFERLGKNSFVFLFSTSPLDRSGSRSLFYIPRLLFPPPLALFFSSPPPPVSISAPVVCPTPRRGPISAFPRLFTEERRHDGFFSKAGLRSPSTSAHLIFSF